MIYTVKVLVLLLTPALFAKLEGVKPRAVQTVPPTVYIEEQPSQFAGLHFKKYYTIRVYRLSLIERVGVVRILGFKKGPTNRFLRTGRIGFNEEQSLIDDSLRRLEKAKVPYQYKVLR